MAFGSDDALCSGFLCGMHNVPHLRKDCHYWQMLERDLAPIPEPNRIDAILARYADQPIGRMIAEEIKGK